MIDDYDDEWDEEDAYDPSIDCDHMDANFDILTGELNCHCGHREILVGERYQREVQLQCDLMEAYAREAEKP